MTVYWVNCFLSCLFMKIADMNNKGTKIINKFMTRFMFVLAILPLTLVAALRYDVGKDYMYTYVPYFYRIVSNKSYEKLEPLYHAINVWVHSFSDDYVWVFVICAIIFMVLVYISIFRDSPYPELSVFLLVGTTYYFIFLNGMRQMIGVSICLFSLIFIEKRQVIPFLMCMVLAAGFHTSCWTFLPLYFIGNIKFNRKIIVSVTAIVFVAAVSIAGKINEFIQSTVYSGYQGSVFDTGEQGYVVLAINIVILIFAMFFYDKNNKKNKIYLNLQIIASWIAILTGKIVLINRIRWMFGLPVIVLLPLTIKNIQNKWLRIGAYIGIVLIYIIYAQYTIGIQNGNAVLEYKTIFSR